MQLGLTFPYFFRNFCGIFILLFLRVAASTTTHNITQHRITSFEFDGREMGVLKIHLLGIQHSWHITSTYLSRKKTRGKQKFDNPQTHKHTLRIRNNLLERYAGVCIALCKRYMVLLAGFGFGCLAGVILLPSANKSVINLI